MTLYMVTSVSSTHNKKVRAICTSYTRALEIIENNETDMYETYFSFLVIEIVESDSPYKENADYYSRIWYQWASNKYEKITCPPAFESYKGFWR